MAMATPLPLGVAGVNTVAMTKALNGIRILDLSRVLAGPWCTQMLGDLGAEVIKIEQPGTGDDTRGWGPPWHHGGHDGGDGGEGDQRLSGYYMSANRGKKSVTIDIAQPDGQALIRTLAAQSDVLVENFKFGGLKKYGLDYDQLKAVNPRLIYCSITGFGQDGPRATEPGYDFMIQGLSGMMSVTGDPASEPQKTGVAYVDVMTGLHAVIAILAAINQRHETGRGQHIDVALFDVAVSTLANQALNYLVSGKPPVHMGNAHPNVVPYQAFATRDGHLILAIGNDGQFARFAALVGEAGWASDPRFQTNSARIANRAAALTAEGIPHGPINRVDQALDDPQAVHRGLVTKAGDRPAIRSPLRLSDSPVDPSTAPPLLGADTDAVLHDVLGLSSDAVAQLRTKGVI
jgi:crotonobetainyl-CoA:carnitine CoA-transferase CaiB-like acyl-CoA transferase